MGVISSLTIIDTSLVIISDRVAFGPNVSLITVSHGTSLLSRQKYVGWGLPIPIRIEDDCWLGAGVTVLPGVTIGRGSTIEAGSVPARMIKNVPTVEEEREDLNNP
ncbi:hypothetical protein E1B28_012049 [Marasmius oreades]|uniref:Mannose-1-phosphate guanylyltransferase n=1 Tax=Marasmius oreades TaxID=181124 RepID=A0A9P7RRA3_9AGAR|nr:uncharacterized protein E1B28_012049 [Marasmius oreades]KAG7088012.1 hypothetical protein E1B28_012049 [Marasmius oreades]